MMKVPDIADIAAEVAAPVKNNMPLAGSSTTEGDVCTAQGLGQAMPSVEG